MSGQDPLEVAKQAERDLNSSEAKTGARNPSDSANDSGINEAATDKFPGSTVTIGSAASGSGDNREIPESEGGDIKSSGQATKAKDFEGVGGPEDKEAQDAINKGGNDDVAVNTASQGGQQT